MNKQDRLENDGIPDDVEPVLFFSGRDKWGGFSNFSDHAVVMPNPWNIAQGIYYKTTEHRFQAMKATTFEDHLYVVEADTAFESKTRGGPGGIRLREGWGNEYGDLCYYVMLEACLEKARAHDDIFDLLRATGDRPIYEDSPVDDIWGWRFQNNYGGKNLLGKVWMQVRDTLL